MNKKEKAPKKVKEPKKKVEKAPKKSKHTKNKKPGSIGIRKTAVFLVVLWVIAAGLLAYSFKTYNDMVNRRLYNESAVQVSSKTDRIKIDSLDDGEKQGLNNLCSQLTNTCRNDFYIVDSKSNKNEEKSIYLVVDNDKLKDVIVTDEVLDSLSEIQEAKEQILNIKGAGYQQLVTDLNILGQAIQDSDKHNYIDTDKLKRLSTTGLVAVLILSTVNTFFVKLKVH